MSHPDKLFDPFNQCLHDRLTHPNDICLQVSGLDCTIASELRFNWRGSIKFPSNHPDAKLSHNQLCTIYDHPNLYLINDVMIIQTISPTDYCLIRETVNKTSERNLPYRTFDFVLNLT